MWVDVRWWFEGMLEQLGCHDSVRPRAAVTTHLTYHHQCVIETPMSNDFDVNAFGVLECTI